MYGAILKTTNSSFPKGITFCHSIYLVSEESYEATCIHIWTALVHTKYQGFRPYDFVQEYFYYL